MFLEVMFLWIPVARLLRFCKARSGFWLVCPMVSRCKLIAKDYMIESANHGCIYCLKGQPCAGEFVSQWLLMGQAPWNKPCHSVEHIFCLTCELPIKNKHDQPIMLKGSLCHSSEALGNTSTPWQPPPLYQRKAPHGCFGEDRVDVRLLFVGCTQSVSGRILIYPVARIQHSKPKLVNKTISKDGRVRVVSFFSIWASNLIIIFLIVQFDHNFLDSWGWTQISFGCVCVLSTSVWYGDSSTIASTGWTTWSWLSPRAYLHGWRSPGELGWLFERSQELLVAKVIT